MTKLIVKQLQGLCDGRHMDGGGMFLHVRGESRVWVYRYQLNKRRRDMRLGKYPTMTLKDARNARSDAERLRDQGIDPVEARKPEAPQEGKIDVARYFWADHLGHLPVKEGRPEGRRYGGALDVTLGETCDTQNRTDGCGRRAHGDAVGSPSADMDHQAHCRPKSIPAAFAGDETGPRPITRRDRQHNH